MMQLIPQKGNEENLMKVPHQKIEDLALVYRFDPGGQPGMTGTKLITNDSLKIERNQGYLVGFQKTWRRLRRIRCLSGIYR